MINSDVIVDDKLTSKRKSDRNYWLHVMFLTAVAIFVPERYSVLIFLGAIWTILFEISDRLREQYYYHRNTANGIAELVSKS